MPGPTFMSPQLWYRTVFHSDISVTTLNHQHLTKSRANIQDQLDSLCCSCCHMPMKHLLSAGGGASTHPASFLAFSLFSLRHTPRIYSIGILTVIASSDHRKVERDSAATLDGYSKSTSQLINQSTNQSVFRCAHNSWIR